MAEYRLVSPEEYLSAVALWTRVFGVPERFFTSLIEGGEAEDNVSLGAFEDGRIVASVHVFMRQIRDRDGRPMKVGGIGSVSTDPDHRKHGHSGRLLEMALKEMERAECVWSFLGTGVNDHYARYGWRTVSTPEAWGELSPLTPDLFPPKGREGIVELTPDDATLDAMRPLYEASSVSRPMATVRSELVWRTAIRYRLSPGKSFTIGAYDGDRLSAYGVAHNPWGSWSFVEAAGDESRFPELFAATAARLRQMDVERVQSGLPEGPGMDAFTSVVERVVPGESRGMMLRPIADRISWPELFALYGEGVGRHCDLDAF